MPSGRSSSLDSLTWRTKESIASANVSDPVVITRPRRLAFVARESECIDFATVSPRIRLNGFDLFAQTASLVSTPAAFGGSGNLLRGQRNSTHRPGRFSVL